MIMHVQSFVFYIYFVFIYLFGGGWFDGALSRKFQESLADFV